MDDLYLAKVYCNELEIASNSGNDIDTLYAWMLNQVKDFGDVHGEIIECKTKKVIRTFRKSEIE